MRIFVQILLALFIVSCQKEEIRITHTEVECGCEYSKYKGMIPEDASERKLYPEYNSIEFLIQDFLKYINNQDRIGLEHLLVSEQEFRDWVFPEYNIANPKCDIPWNMVHKSLRNKSAEGIDIMTQDLSEKQFSYIGYEFTNQEQEEEFETYEFYNRTLIYVDTEQGEETIAVAGSVIEMNGTYKFLSYRENNFYYE